MEQTTYNLNLIESIIIIKAFRYVLQMLYKQTNYTIHLELLKI